MEPISLPYSMPGKVQPPPYYQPPHRQPSFQQPQETFPTEDYSDLHYQTTQRPPGRRGGPKHRPGGRQLPSRQGKGDKKPLPPDIEECMETFNLPAESRLIFTACTIA